MCSGTNPGSTFPPSSLIPPLSASGETAWRHSFQHSQSTVVSSPCHGHHRSLLRHAFLCSCALRHFYEIRLQSQLGQVVRQSSTCRSQVHCPYYLLAHWKSELLLTGILAYLQQPLHAPRPFLLSLFWVLWPCLSWFFSSSSPCQPNPFPKVRNLERGL